MNEEQALEQIAGIIRQVFDNEDLRITAGTTAADVPGWDSMRNIEVVMLIERRFGIRLHSREIDSMQNVGDLSRGVLSKLAPR